MTEREPIAAWRSSTLCQLRLARGEGSTEAEQRILDELVSVHVALGQRLVGTREEQNTYLMARSTSTPVPELLEAGIDTNGWPAPPHRPAVAEPRPASPATEQRITDLFQAAGTLVDTLPVGPRYQTRFRPEDGHRFHNEPLHWALWDTHEDIPIAYHPDRDLCDYQAAMASEAFANRRKPT
ncbi:hypothetical protein OHS33_38540 (plasmid) [Streptomyces sp. NBC_00536]|uniref:hypothetical protein n=1 Tax=Streptomyces sp. NBC_00536 TaxID=2975769 RepID=UPI002E81C6F8|nr:hypothetical protein [Streptomyces sp. NBC_00536]WUC84403.1 hypothetical protein OHS33_38540 [Streptomyces sp. NBC_00536]